VPHTPPDHEPRGGPAHQARWPEGVDTLVVAQLGVQGPNRDDLREPLAELVALTASAHGPSKVDRAWHADAHDVVNEVLICYWTDPAEHEKWWASAPVATWWAARPLDGPLGWWREVLTSPVRRFETMYSAPVPVGPAAVAETMDPTNLHDYAFAALDRIPESEHDQFVSEGKFVTDLPAGSSPLGRVVTVTSAPVNLCLIRTAQDWSMAPDEQTSTYGSLVEPGYREGVTYLRDNASESGCVGARLLRETDADGAELPRSSTVAWFGGIADLLRWAHHHPTHHRILGDFWTGMVEPYNVDLRLLLWHEVHVAPAGGVRMEYVNCHPGTGVLATR
jgi:aldoxime dehydratase